MFRTIAISLFTGMLVISPTVCEPPASQHPEKKADVLKHNSNTIQVVVKELDVKATGFDKTNNIYSAEKHSLDKSKELLFDQHLHNLLLKKENLKKDAKYQNPISKETSPLKVVPVVTPSGDSKLDKEEKPKVSGNKYNQKKGKRKYKLNKKNKYKKWWKQIRAELKRKNNRNATKLGLTKKGKKENNLPQKGIPDKGKKGKTLKINKKKPSKAKPRVWLRFLKRGKGNQNRKRKRIPWRVMLKKHLQKVFDTKSKPQNVANVIPRITGGKQTMNTTNKKKMRKWFKKRQIKMKDKQLPDKPKADEINKKDLAVKTIVKAKMKDAPRVLKKKFKNAPNKSKKSRLTHKSKKGNTIKILNPGQKKMKLKFRLLKNKGTRRDKKGNLYRKLMKGKKENVQKNVSNKN